jgi:hypothetical protein
MAHGRGNYPFPNCRNARRSSASSIMFQNESRRNRTRSAVSGRRSHSGCRFAVINLRRTLKDGLCSISRVQIARPSARSRVGISWTHASGTENIEHKHFCVRKSVSSICGQLREYSILHSGANLIRTIPDCTENGSGCFRMHPESTLLLDRTPLAK